MSFILQFAPMLIILKGSLALRVQCGTGAVWIQPVVGEYDNVPLLTTMARNEELLVQVYLSHQEITDTRAQVAEYFEQRGWMVKIPGITNPGMEKNLENRNDQ